MQDQIVEYPIQVKPVEENGCRYLVYLPDFKGYTEGVDYQNALFMARDYIGTRSLCNELPPASQGLPLVRKFENVHYVKVNITDFRLQHGVQKDGYL